MQLNWSTDEIVVAVLNNEEVGFCGVELREGYVYIDGLEVSQGYTSRGIGRALLRAVFAKFGNVEYRLSPVAIGYNYGQTPPLSQEKLEAFYASEGFKYSHPRRCRVRGGVLLY